jgi:hypothetical protein
MTASGVEIRPSTDNLFLMMTSPSIDSELRIVALAHTDISEPTATVPAILNESHKVRSPDILDVWMEGTNPNLSTDSRDVRI